MSHVHVTYMRARAPRAKPFFFLPTHFRMSIACQHRNAKYAGFSEYYSSSFAAALQKVNEASNAVSGVTWFVAFNALALNFAQLILIERLIGALVLAARLHAVADDADRGRIIK